MILAFECDAANVAMCAPDNVSDLFTFEPLIHGLDWLTRTHVLIMLAALLAVGLMWFGLRKRRLVPTKFQLVAESAFDFVDRGIARDVIGVGGERFTPYLLSLFLFILFSNVFEVAPFINFPVTSRMALPAFLALLTWVIFLSLGLAKQGIGYFGRFFWDKEDPLFVNIIRIVLVGPIEVISMVLVRPFSLAVRLFANLVAGHVMLSLLLGTAGIFVWGFVTGDLGFGKAVTGGAWFVLGIGIYLFEILVAFLQAYIFTLLAAVYIQDSVHPEH